MNDKVVVWLVTRRVWRTQENGEAVLTHFQVKSSAGVHPGVVVAAYTGIGAEDRAQAECARRNEQARRVHIGGNYEGDDGRQYMDLEKITFFDTFFVPLQIEALPRAPSPLPDLPPRGTVTFAAETTPPPQRVPIQGASLAPATRVAIYDHKRRRPSFGRSAADQADDLYQVLGTILKDQRHRIAALRWSFTVDPMGFWRRGPIEVLPVNLFFEGDDGQPASSWFDPTEGIEPQAPREYRDISPQSANLWASSVKEEGFREAYRAARQLEAWFDEVLEPLREFPSDLSHLFSNASSVEVRLDSDDTHLIIQQEPRSAADSRGS